jgi:protein-L-isoaspartate O-methyltransferase
MNTTTTRTEDITHAATLPQADASSLVDAQTLEAKVKEMYRQVAREDHAELHFDLGRELAEHLGYPRELLDAIPNRALASFAGVGYHLDLAALVPGERVLDLGSGSGTDVFAAAVQVGQSIRVVGLDFTSEQLTKAAALRDPNTFAQVSFAEASIDELPFDDETFDAVILQRRDQPLPGQGPRLRGGSTSAPTRWTARARRHRQRQASQGDHQAQHRTLGRLRRRRDPTDELHRHDPGRRLRTRPRARQQLPVRLRTRTQRLHHLRSRKHLASSHQACVNLYHDPLPDHPYRHELTRPERPLPFGINPRPRSETRGTHADESSCIVARAATGRRLLLRVLADLDQQSRSRVSQPSRRPVVRDSGSRGHWPRWR